MQQIFLNVLSLQSPCSQNDAKTASSSFLFALFLLAIHALDCQGGRLLQPTSASHKRGAILGGLKSLFDHRIPVT